MCDVKCAVDHRHFFNSQLHSSELRSFCELDLQFQLQFPIGLQPLSN
jgi:hypothetical protein